MATRKTKRTARSSKQSEYPSWVWMLFGLSIGLSVALAVYIKDRGATVAALPRQQPVSLQSALDDNNEAPAPAAEPEPKSNRFTFYDMLPNFEVVIPEQEQDVAADNAPGAVLEPGVYVLQAGSFSAFADADRRRAQLALQGIESKIQRVTIDDKTYHRVRIGPIDDLDKLNVLRSRLRSAQIDALRIRLGD
jgi:cell division protein FtsN